MKFTAAAAVALGVVALMLTVNGQSKIACDPDNGGTLIYTDADATSFIQSLYRYVLGRAPEA